MGPYYEEEEQDQQYCAVDGSLMGVTYDDGDIQPVCPKCGGREVA
jgi:hypothetical protein